MNFKKFLFLLPSFFLLSSCQDVTPSTPPSTNPLSSPSISSDVSSSPDSSLDSSLPSSPVSSSSASSSTIEEKTPLGKAIDKARNGFASETTRYQRVFDRESLEPVFENRYDLSYAFQNVDGIKTRQAFDSGDEEISMAIARDEEGYACEEYIDYRNEVALSPLLDSEGYYVRYDYHYGNPFLYLTEKDFSEVEESVFEVNEDKIDYVSYLLFGNTTPLVEMRVTLDGELFATLETTSIDADSFTKDLPDKTQADEYYPVVYRYETLTTFSEMGSYRLESPQQSPVSTQGDAVGDFLRTIGENYTLESTLSFLDDSSIASTMKTYFDGETCYVDYDASIDDLSQDSLFAPDVFGEEGLLYEYNYVGGSWALVGNTSSTSYNIDPQGKDYFIPHAKDISDDLFVQGEEEGHYRIDNSMALSHIGNGFLSDFQALPYYEFGYIEDVDIALENDAIAIAITFLYPTSYGAYEMVYEYTYSDIGTTIVPVTL